MKRVSIEITLDELQILIHGLACRMGTQDSIKKYGVRVGSLTMLWLEEGSKPPTPRSQGG